MKRGLLSSIATLLLFITLLQKSVQGRFLPSGSEAENGTLRSEPWTKTSVEQSSEQDGNQKPLVRTVPKVPDGSNSDADKSGFSPPKNEHDADFDLKALYNNAFTGHGINSQMAMGSRIRRSLKSGNLDLSHFYGFDGESGGKASKEQEKILRLMALLTSKEGGYAGGSRDEQENEDLIEDDEDPPLDLGYYGNHPYNPTSSSSGKLPIMSHHDGVDDAVPIHRHYAIRRSGNPALKAGGGRFIPAFFGAKPEKRNIKPTYGNNFYSLGQLLGNLQEVDPLTPVYHRGIL